jgi:hypothetical protein
LINQIWSSKNGQGNCIVEKEFSHNQKSFSHTLDCPEVLLPERPRNTVSE